jgi:uncharacterized membrane protein YdjX (TVP38/TMEM64 family)
MQVETPPATSQRGRRGSQLLRGGLIVAALILAAALFRLTGLDRFLSIEALAENRDWLLAEVARLGVIAVAVFIVVYAIAVALSFPGALILTITSGFLFGPVLGSVYAVTGATLGAVGLFLFVRMGLGDSMRSRAGGAVDRLRRGFADNALGYLLFLRLLPIFPFWLVNLAAALLAVPLRTFVIATAVGIIPGSAVYASFGSGLGSLLDEGKPIDLGSILTPSIFLPLLALAVLALAPALYQRFNRSKGAA